MPENNVKTEIKSEYDVTEVQQELSIHEKDSKIGANTQELVDNKTQCIKQEVKHITDYTSGGLLEGLLTRRIKNEKTEYDHQNHAKIENVFIKQEVNIKQERNELEDINEKHFKPEYVSELDLATLHTNESETQETKNIKQAGDFAPILHSLLNTTTESAVTASNALNNAFSGTSEKIQTKSEPEVVEMENLDADMVIKEDELLIKDEEIKEISATQSNPLKCPECNFTAKNAIYVKKHIKRKHTTIDTLFACEQCEYTTPLKHNLKVHMQYHNKVKKYSCLSCDYKTFSKSSLNVHMDRKHNDGTPYPCGQCNYSNSSKFGLQEHMRNHHQGVIFSCPQCDYKTSFKRSITVHIDRKHSDESTTYSCENCEYQNSSKYELKRHIRNYHKNGIFECSECEYSTSIRRDLNIHIERKHNVNKTTYICEHCDYTSASKYNYQQHVARLHRPGTVQQN